MSESADACEMCAGRSCCEELTTCSNNRDCNAVADCLSPCTTDACIEACVSAHPTGSELLLDFGECMDTNCSTQCEDEPESNGGFCTLSSHADSCETCTKGTCCEQLTSCGESDQCLDVLDCVGNCTTDSCIRGCLAAYPTGSIIMLDLLECMDTSCSDECG